MADELGDAKICGRLYIVAVPTGDPGDITLRAKDVLRSVETVVCQEYREGSKLLKMLGVERPLIELNEHNERIQAQQIADRLRQAGERKSEFIPIVGPAPEERTRQGQRRPRQPSRRRS